MHSSDPPSGRFSSVRGCGFDQAGALLHRYGAATLPDRGGVSAAAERSSVPPQYVDEDSQPRAPTILQAGAIARCDLATLGEDPVLPDAAQPPATRASRTRPLVLPYSLREREGMVGQG